ncbi:MAG: hypothetical protein O3C43_18495 [Verrucomicrobia bacterium]|nr:hypothetical protein [Verrucomicrobiota bacterium]MDA1068480.1 hypothetical protein [Verrucomicrobiota bacterium]
MNYGVRVSIREWPWGFGAGQRNDLRATFFGMCPDTVIDKEWMI